MDGLKITAPPTELSQGYEALRAQALGESPRLRPRGLAVLARAGLAGWMCACAPRSHARPAAGAATGARAAGAITEANAELVRVLAEMALSSRGRCCA